MNRFHDRIRPAVENELRAARAAERLGHIAAAHRYLQRAHVLGQMSTRLHTRVHARMLWLALRHGQHRAALGQLVRVAAAATKTVFGAVPHGNTGGSDVSPFRPMPVAPDLQRLIDAARA